MKLYRLNGKWYLLLRKPRKQCSFGVSF